MEKNQPLVGRLVDPETLTTENPPVDEFMKQQSELLDMIAGGLAGLSALSAERNFPTEKINKILSKYVIRENLIILKSLSFKQFQQKIMMRF